jgi:hypothetical protein
MTMSRKDRFKMKSQLVETLGSHEWSFDQTNLLLGEFGIEPLSGDWQGPSMIDVLGNVSDTTLVELYALVMGIDTEEVEDAVESSEAGNWKPGYIRVFLSHSAQYKEFIGDVANELAVVGIHGFVAHDTMEYSKPWQTQIEQALRSMQAFVAIIHPEFNGSAWCHQEIGWARGRRVPHYAVRMGADPAGFVGRDQWPSAAGQTPKQVAHIITSWVSALPELGSTVADGLFAALRSAGNYMDAGAAAERIVSLGSLTQEQFQQLDEIYWNNDQVRGGALPSRALRPFYVQNGRQWPPAKAQQASAPLDSEGAAFPF